MENDEIILEKAAATVATMDIRYKRAAPTDKVILKPERDRAFSAYAGARLKLMEAGTVSSEDDVQEMGEIRRQVSHARKTQSLVIAIGRFVGFLSKFL